MGQEKRGTTTSLFVPMYAPNLLKSLATLSFVVLTKQYLNIGDFNA